MERGWEIEQYQAVAEVATEAFVTIDERSRIQSANPAVEGIFGYEPSELVGEPITTLMPEDLADRHLESLQRYLDTGERHLDWEYIELPGRHADGHEVPLAISFSEFERDGDRYFTGIIRDVTDRKRFEETLTALHDTTRELFRAGSREEVASLVVDAASDVLEFTDVALYLWDDERGDLFPVDKSTDVGFMWEELPRVPPDDSTLVGHAYAENESVLADDIRESPYFIGEETDMRAGLYAPIGDYGVVFAGSTTTGAFDGRDRQLLELLAENAEVAFERLEQARDLEASERRYRTLVENFPNGAVTLYDEDLRYVAAGGENVARLGLTPDDLVGSRVEEALPDGLADQLVPHYHAAIETDERQVFDAEHGGRHYHFRTIPVRDESGEVFAGMAMSQEITERKEYERKLEASNERLEQFAYAASHDLQEPLRMVSNYVGLLEERYADELDEDAEEFVEYAVDGVERMREMIDQLLEYARVESRGNPFDAVDLDAVLDDVLDDLQLRIDETGTEITRDPLPTVRGDGHQLRQVVQNLLDNAIEYSGDEPPRIHVSAERDGEQWIVSVRDEGIGLDPEQADRAFAVFQRLHSREEHDGTGIGLALCRRIVERHGGDIWVDSEPGEGATFSFTVPAIEET